MELTQAWPRPSQPRPIVIIGAGAIVRTAHLPAYRRLGLPVAGIFDIRIDAARAAFNVATVFESLDAAVSVRDAVFDVAVPASELLGILEHLPGETGVLM